MKKILIVDDQVEVRELVEVTLRIGDFKILQAESGPQGLEMARAEKPDVIVLDVMLPELDGFEVCRILRKETIVPILMLTARAEEIDRVVGLELGADDYLTKPFSLRELLARIHALLRRVEMMKEETLSADEAAPPILKAADLEIDFARHRVSRGESVLGLSHREFDLLAFLARNRGRVFGRDLLLEKVWGYDYAGNTRTVDVHVRWLRQKIEDNPSHPRHLLTVRGAGYKFEV